VNRVIREREWRESVSPFRCRRGLRWCEMRENEEFLRA
jgi:hypothetical protein